MLNSSGSHAQLGRNSHYTDCTIVPVTMHHSDSQPQYIGRCFSFFNFPDKTITTGRECIPCGYFHFGTNFVIISANAKNLIFIDAMNSSLSISIIIAALTKSAIFLRHFDQTKLVKHPVYIGHTANISKRLRTLNHRADLLNVSVRLQNRAP